MLPQPTTRQQAFLDYLEQEITTNGKSPSLRKAAKDLGVSHTAIAQILDALEEKGCIRREGKYSRTIHLLNRRRDVSGVQRWKEIPIIGKIAAGLPLYAQQEWDGTLVVDASLYRQAAPLFALRVRGDSMVDAGILNGDLVICEPRQFAGNGEIVVALIDHEEATVKRFFLHGDSVELQPANAHYRTMQYGFDRVLIQGKVIGVQRGPDQMGSWTGGGGTTESEDEPGGDPRGDFGGNP